MATSVKLSSFPGNATVFVQAFSNAQYNQAVTIQPPSGASAVFSGAGEHNVPQALTTQGFLTANPGGQPSFVVPSGGGEYTISVTANQKPSQVMAESSTLLTPSSGQILIGWVSSEDSQDEDWNDSVVIFTTYIAGESTRRTP
jgi:hypothetical protein